MDRKTNMMRLLEQKRVSYVGHSYADTDATSGMEVARALGENPAQVFKTLVTVGKNRQYYMFVIPVAAELDLKKAAKTVGERSVEMIKAKELPPLTGYIRGGCSPIGMKKSFKTTVDSLVVGFETIISSAGRVGYQVEVSPEDLKKTVRYEPSELTADTDI